MKPTIRVFGHYGTAAGRLRDRAGGGAIPIGRGQRELIIGDRDVGKTVVAVDALIVTLQLKGRDEAPDGPDYDQMELVGLATAGARAGELEKQRRAVREKILDHLAEIKGDKERDELAKRLRALNQISIAQRGVFDRAVRYYAALGRQVEQAERVPQLSDIPDPIRNQAAQIRASQEPLRTLLVKLEDRL